MEIRKVSAGLLSNLSTIAIGFVFVMRLLGQGRKRSHFPLLKTQLIKVKSENIGTSLVICGAYIMLL